MLPISAAIGVRFALGSGSSRSDVPVRSAIFGTVLAITVLMATITFGASLDDLVSHPSLYGWNWNYALLASFAGQEDLPSKQVAALLDHDRDVQAWSGVNFVQVKLDGQVTEVMAEVPRASVAPPLLSGHGLNASDEIVLGRATLAQLGLKVGDDVTLTKGGKRPMNLIIVGTAAMPSIVKGLGAGAGAVAAPSDFPPQLLNQQQATIPGPNAVLVRIRAGVGTAAGYRSLQEINDEVNEIPAASGLAGGVVSALRPIEIVNFRSMRTTPALLAAGLGIGALVALGLTLDASVRRRRRDLALLKALGFTERQLAAAIAWQSTVAAVVGVVVGVPLGIALGRELWILFARSINVVPEPTASVLSIVLVGLGTIVFANVIAAVPARRAARTSTALVLRTE
jgi:hypothetical protein